MPARLTSVVLVLHGSATRFFATENTGKYRKVLTRADSLVSGEVIKLKMCNLSADAQGYKPEGIHGLVKLVPMGDAETIRLQYEEDHAYTQ